jgi:2-polyprenyl-6-methoxyphenol hydroxylase-like FAD-dependent oxidoreductase
MNHECLIVGAGPTGLALAIELRRFGLLVRLIDKADRPAQWSQALVVQARTLEQFDRYGIADQAVAQGRKISKAQIWSNTRQIAVLDFATIPSRFPYLLFLPQNQTEELLTAHLRSLGVEIERQVELIGFENTDDDIGISAQMGYSDGHEKRERFRWIVGCDGAHSTVRAGMGVAFKGTTSSLNFQLGDLRLAGQDVPGDELQIHLHRGGDVLALGRLRDGICRVVLALHRQQTSDQQRVPELEDFNAAFKRCGLRITAEAAIWKAPFSVNQRKAAQYRQGSVFLAGDAAHIHSPVGGQGMNTGIQDAANLAWKLAAVGQGANVRLLDSYNEERGKVGEQLLRGTARGLKLATASNLLLGWVRDFLIHTATRFQMVQTAIGRTISEVSINYRGSSIVRTHGVNGPLRAGDRMPDAMHKETGHTLLAALREPRHLLITVDHSVPEITKGLRQITTTVALESSSREWIPSIERLLGTGPGIYLVRPDGYIGFAGKSAEALRKYAHEVGLL